MKIARYETDKAWDEARRIWGYPDIPYPIVYKDTDEILQAKDPPKYLVFSIACMTLDDLQISINLEYVNMVFYDDIVRGFNLILRHEIGHSFCPGDIETHRNLVSCAEEELSNSGKKEAKSFTQTLCDYFTNHCVDAILAKRGYTEDIVWGYRKVYLRFNSNRYFVKTAEFLFKESILPEDVLFTENELALLKKQAEIFDHAENKDNWSSMMRDFTRISVEYDLHKKYFL